MNCCLSVTSPSHTNLFHQLLDGLGIEDRPPWPATTSLYAAACQLPPTDEDRALALWTHALQLGGILPTLPLWLTEDLAAPLDSQESYQDASRVLRISTDMAPTINPRHERIAE